jgi:hypothetical protein
VNSEGEVIKRVLLSAVLKNVNKGMSGRKDFFGSLVGRKRVCIFSARGLARNVREKSNEEKKSKKG